MPRALRGRIEPPDHFVLGHVSILGPLSALGSPHAARRFIGLAIVVRRKDRGSRITNRSHERRATHRPQFSSEFGTTGNDKPSVRRAVERSYRVSSSRVYFLDETSRDLFICAKYLFVGATAGPHTWGRQGG